MLTVLPDHHVILPDPRGVKVGEFSESHLVDRHRVSVAAICPAVKRCGAISVLQVTVIISAITVPMVPDRFGGLGTILASVM